MAINLATKYSKKVDELIRLGLLTAPGVNNDVDFIGAKSVKIYSMQSVPLNDYTASGSNRYGTPLDIQDTLQEMTMTQEKSFSFVIDKTHAVDSPDGVRDAGALLRLEIDERIVPEIDRYRLSVMSNGAGRKTYSTISAQNAYIAFLAANTAVTDEEFPVEGRVAFCSNAFIEALKTSSEFTRNTELAQEGIIFKGQVGTCDGVAIVGVPKRRLPAGISFIITHPVCTAAPVKVQDYKLHEDPPGYAGHLVEGLIYHDAFVFDKKKVGIAAHYGVLDTLTIGMIASTEEGKGTVTVSGEHSGATLVYKTAASVTAPALGDDLSAWTEFPANGVITATATHKVCVAAVDSDNKAVATSAPITVAVGEA